MPEAALRALSTRVTEAREALEGDGAPASILADLDAIRDLTFTALECVVRGRNDTQTKAAVASKLGGIFQALADAYRALVANETERVREAIFAMNVAVSDALATYPRFKV